MHRLALFSFALVAMNTVCAEDWPQFRGLSELNCSGVSTSTAPLPSQFSSTEHVKWSAKLGNGIGSPVVAAGRIFTSAMVDPRTIGLYAFDASSGKQLWTSCPP